jgi:hypothetical protein
VADTGKPDPPGLGDQQADRAGVVHHHDPLVAVKGGALQDPFDGLDELAVGLGFGT